MAPASVWSAVFRRVRDAAATVSYRGGALIACVLPRSAAYALAGFCGLVRCATAPGLRAIVAANVAVACGPRATGPTVRRATRACFRDFGRAVVDVLRLPEWTPARVARYVRAEGEDLLHAARAAGRGVVIVSAHLGSWEVGGAYLATLGLPVHVVARPHDAPGVERWMLARRARVGLRVVPLTAPLRALLDPLRRGGCVALLADRPHTESDEPVLFCGRTARLPRGPVTLALRTGAPLLAAVALREGDGYRIVWRAIPTDDLPATRDGIRRGVERMARALEPFVRAHPAQWHAFTPVWTPRDAAPARETRPPAVPAVAYSQTRRASA